MNLETIQENVEHELRHAPTAARWRRKLLRKVNQVHEELCGLHDWPWMYTETTLRVWPAFEVDTWTIGNAGSGDHEYITFNDSYLADGVGTEDLTGAEVVMPGGDVFVVEYGWVTGGGSVQLHLDPSFPTGVTPSGNITVRKTRHRLPVDVAEVAGCRLVEPGQGDRPMVPVTSHAHLASLLNTSEGDPCLYATAAPWNDYVTDSLRPAGQSYRDQLRNEPPRDAPALAEAATGSAVYLSGGQTYYYCTAWLYGGRVSPPSPVSSITFSGTASTAIRATVNRDNTFPGRKLALFRSDSQEGPFYLLIDDVTTFVADIGGDLNTEPHSRHETRLDRMQRQGAYEYLRFWPAPHEVATIKVHYRRRPAKLLEATDEPELPVQHSIIVYRVASALAGRRAPDLQRRMAKLAEAPMKALVSTLYPPERHARFQAGVVGASVGPRSVGHHFIPPNINWISET